MRPAFTLLELMIALGLLGALLSVAWSLMGTFSLAEQRGWKITQRTQTLRAARLWLEQDLDQLSISDQVNPSSQTAVNPLSGTELQFTLRIAPSLDPLPFFERLMSASLGDMSSTTQVPASRSGLPALESGGQVLEEGAPDGFSAEPIIFPWGSGTLTVAYELSPMLDRDADSGAGSDVGGADDTQYELIRRERLDQTQVASEDAAAGLGDSGSPADRLLTTADLYRQTDEGFEQGGMVVRESRLAGLVRPRFQYCDGQTWRSQWDARSSGRLPTAIALSFDFPDRAQMRRQETRSQTDEAVDDFGLDSQSLLASAPEGVNYASEALLEVDTSGETSLLQAGEREYQIILRISNPPTQWTSSAAVPATNFPAASAMGGAP